MACVFFNGSTFLTIYIDPYISSASPWSRTKNLSLSEMVWLTGCTFKVWITSLLSNLKILPSRIFFIIGKSSLYSILGFMFSSVSRNSSRSLIFLHLLFPDPKSDLVPNDSCSSLIYARKDRFMEAISSIWSWFWVRSNPLLLSYLLAPSEIDCLDPRLISPLLAILNGVFSLESMSI